MKSILILFLSLFLNFYCANANNSLMQQLILLNLQMFTTLNTEIKTDTIKNKAIVLKQEDCPKEIKSSVNSKDNIKYWEEVRTRVIDVGGKPNKI